MGAFPVTFGNDGHFLTTRLSYKLNLRGPSVDVQSACSTSLVAISLACRSLLHYECDAALAGGVSISFPQIRGYLYLEGGMVSQDGHCRTFDARADGTVFGSGAGVVVLKRLSDALEQRDRILAVIRGFAVNNDGSQRVAYTAPSVDGQAEVIALAQAMAGVDPRAVGYVEGHGTATPLGDPIEIAGLTKAFRAGTKDRGFCALGSIKPNVGHLDAAAGVTGLVKTVLALRDHVLPPTLHFTAPNPHIDLAASPFFVSARALPWESDRPRLAGVSAFGVGGTNAHVVLEEAPIEPPSGGLRSHHLFVLSAKTPAALDAATRNLAAHLAAHPDLEPGDVARTLQTGRRAFEHRRAFVAQDVASARAILGGGDARRLPTASVAGSARRATFLFPGQGSQSPGMGAELYAAEPVFRGAFDRCATLLEPHLGLDLRAAVFGTGPGAAEALTRTGLAQPAIFSLSWSLAELWESWGVRPVALAGHSVGEFVAGCRAGVFSLEDALRLVAARGRLMEERPTGSMLAVRLSEADVKPYLEDHLDLAAVNAPALVVVSGDRAAVDALETRLAAAGVASRRLVTSHAFHSRMMDPVLAPFTAEVARLRLSPPTVPIVSTVTGRTLSASEATSADYWIRHFRVPVRFSDALATLLEDPARLLLEVGPGQTLATLAKGHPSRATSHAVLASHAASRGRHVGGGASSRDARPPLALGVSGGLAGTSGRRERRRLVSLPTYPFERKRYWIDAGAAEPRRQAARDRRRRKSGPRLAAPTTCERLASAPSVPAPGDRRARLAAEILRTLGEQSGFPESDLSPTSNFLELGFDSLVLTQVSQELQKQFGVRISFRQLLDESATPSSLAAWIDGQLAPDALPAAAEPASRGGTGCGAGLTARRPLAAAPRPVEADRGAPHRGFDPHSRRRRPPAPAAAPTAAPPEEGVRGVRSVQADRGRGAQRPDRAAASRALGLHAALHGEDRRLQTHDGRDARPVRRPARRSRLQASLERDRLPHRRRALVGLAHLGHRRQRVRRHAHGVRPEHVRPLARVRDRRGRRAAPERRRDRAAIARRGSRGMRSSASSRGWTARRSATPAPRP